MKKPSVSNYLTDVKIIFEVATCSDKKQFVPN